MDCMEMENNGRKSLDWVESQGKDCNVELLFLQLSMGLMAESEKKLRQFMQLELILRACLWPSRCGVLLSVNALWYSQRDNYKLYMHCSAQSAGTKSLFPYSALTCLVSCWCWLTYWSPQHCLFLPVIVLVGIDSF